jgi:hypothetical protein
MDTPSRIYVFFRYVTQEYNGEFPKVKRFLVHEFENHVLCPNPHPTPPHPICKVSSAILSPQMFTSVCVLLHSCHLHFVKEELQEHDTSCLEVAVNTQLESRALQLNSVALCHQ